MENKPPIALLNTADVAEYSGKNSRKSGRFSLFMVFFNGLVLVLTIFIVLMIYTDKINKEFYEENSNRVVSDLKSNLNYIGQSFLLLSSVNQTNAFKAHLIHGIDYIYYVSKNDTKTVKTIYINDPSNKIISPLNPGEFEYDDSNDLNYKAGKQGAELIVQDESGLGFYVARLDMNFFNQKLETVDYEMIEQLHLYDSENGTELISFERNRTGEKTNEDMFSNFHSFNLFGHDMEVSLTVNQGDHLVFNNKIPFIFLLFGVVLTIIGLLFVRNNQKQAMQINVMNEALEKKNKDLESKIDEASSISKTLKEKELEYKDVINSVQDILFEVDETGRIVFLNKSWENITQYEIDKSYGEDLIKLFHDQDQEALRIQFFEFIKDMEPNSLRVKLKNRDLSYRMVDISFSVVRQDTADIKHIIGTIHDVEEKARAQKALDEVEKKYRKIFDNAASGIYQIAPDGSILSGNPSLAHILGYSNVDEILMDNSNIENVYVRKADFQLYKNEITRQNFIRNFEEQIRCQDGKVIWVNNNARVVRDDDGEILYYEGAIEDITQRKQAELELKEAKVNSDLASRAKSEFLTNMSHELRTPLNAIIGFSEIIKGEALGEIENKSYVDYAKDIHLSGARLLSVINEILGISKIEAGERNINETLIDLKSICQTCMDLMASKIDSSQLLIANVIQNDIPQIIGEELAFKQMVMNLLSNAIKFTPKGGTVTFDVEYDMDNEEQDLRLSITDTGVGIDEADIPKAMSPFGQLDNALSKSHGGTGLGLTLVESLIGLHGGRVELLSQKGLGTTVTLVIPSKRVAVKKKTQSNEDPQNITKFSDYK